jgi:hypothetical protein
MIVVKFSEGVCVCVCVCVCVWYSKEYNTLPMQTLVYNSFSCISITQRGPVKFHIANRYTQLASLRRYNTWNVWIQYAVAVYLNCISSYPWQDRQRSIRYRISLKIRRCNSTVPYIANIYRMGNSSTAYNHHDNPDWNFPTVCMVVHEFSGLCVFPSILSTCAHQPAQWHQSVPIPVPHKVSKHEWLLLHISRHICLNL